MMRGADRELSRRYRIDISMNYFLNSDLKLRGKIIK